MGRRRGFLAELNHQIQMAERRQQQQARAAFRAQAAAQRASEQAHRQLERARAAEARANIAEQKAAEQEAARSHLEWRLSEVSELNANLAMSYEAIDSLLAATLEVDDWVDLESLRVTIIEHPAFDPHGLDVSLPPPPPPVYPAEPIWQPPAEPRGLNAALGGRKRYEAELAHAQSIFQRDHNAWHSHCASIHEGYQAGIAQHAAAEHHRQSQLAERYDAYQQQCAERETKAAQQNAELDRLINELAFDVPAAIQEYVEIVLSNSVYPDVFPVAHDHRFDLETRELSVIVAVPAPDAVPSVKEYKYVKARDEITSTSLTMKDKKDRYAGAVHQAALRTFHEVFEADRAGKIRSIALTVVVTTTDPATGQQLSVPLVAAAADRETFMTFDLANVVPSATLKHLGAAMSKSPFDLAPADTGRGVRVRNSTS